MTNRFWSLFVIAGSACAGTQVGPTDPSDGGASLSCPALLPATDAGVSAHRVTVTTEIRREWSASFWRPDIKAYPYGDGGTAPGTAALISETDSVADGGETETTALEYPYGFAPYSGLSCAYISHAGGPGLNTNDPLRFDYMLHDLGPEVERNAVALNIQAETTLWPSPRLELTHIEATLPDGGIVAAQESGMRFGPLAGPGGIDEMLPILVTAEAPVSVRFARGRYQANGRPYHGSAASIEVSGQTVFWRQKYYAFRSELMEGFVGHFAEGPWSQTDGGPGNLVTAGIFPLGPMLTHAGVCPSDIAGLRFTLQLTEATPNPVLTGEALLVSGATVALGQ